MKELARTSTTLPVKLTEGELRTKGDELAVVCQQVDEEEVSQKNLKDQMKAKLSELESRRTRLALVISRREEYREIEVVRQISETGDIVTETRTDTGEILQTRPARDNERQQALGI